MPALSAMTCLIICNIPTRDLAFASAKLALDLLAPIFLASSFRCFLAFALLFSWASLRSAGLVLSLLLLVLLVLP